MIGTQLLEKQITPAILKHMDHQEDLLYYGPDGAQMLIETLEDTFSFLKSDVPEHGSKITWKIDGSPAVLAATDFHGERFVSLKHSWDKGKRFHSENEIDEAYPDASQKDLADKLKNLLRYLGMIGIPSDEIWMGDFMFSNEDLIHKRIDGVDYIIFRPNTVVYAVPESDPLSRRIENADIGIVWHTTYTGSDYENLTKRFNADVSKLNDIPAVFQSDVNMAFNTILFSKEESISIDYKMSALRRTISELASDPNYGIIIDNKKLVARMQKYKNEIIRNYQVETGDLFSPENLIKVMSDEMDTHIKELSRETDKARNIKKKKEMISFLESVSKTIDKFYEAQNRCIELKNIFIEKMESTIGMKMFYQSMSRGYIPCGGEGFVVSDVDGNVAKLVTRIGFSLANWQEDIIKGWMSDKRSSSIQASKN